MNEAISTKILQRKSTASLEEKLPKTLSTEINSHLVSWRALSQCIMIFCNMNHHRCHRSWGSKFIPNKALGDTKNQIDLLVEKLKSEIKLLQIQAEIYEQQILKLDCLIVIWLDSYIPIWTTLLYQNVRDSRKKRIRIARKQF